MAALLEKGDPTKDGAAIRDGLAKAGFTVLDDRSAAGSFVRPPEPHLDPPRWEAEEETC